MPKATVAKNTERFDLKTVPEGFVVVRRMSFGEKLERQDDMMTMKTEDKELSFSLLNKRATLKDFGNLVLEHNLTDENDRPLNFKNAADVVALDPRVGEEIQTLIDQINSFEETTEVKN